MRHFLSAKPPLRQISCRSNRVMLTLRFLAVGTEGPARTKPCFIPTFVFSGNVYNEEFHQMFGEVGAGQIQ